MAVGYKRRAAPNAGAIHAAAWTWCVQPSLVHKPSFLYSSTIVPSHRTNSFHFIVPPNFYYNQQQQQQQQQPMSTAASSVPVSTFSPHDPSQPMSTPPSTASQPQPTMKSASPALEASKPSGHSPVPPSLEAQRVTALLELNSVLLQEVVNLQNAGKADMSAHSQQPSPPHEQGLVTPASGQRTQQPSPPEEKGSTTPAANQRGQQSGKPPPPKDYIEYRLLP